MQYSFVQSFNISPADFRAAAYAMPAAAAESAAESAAGAESADDIASAPASGESMFKRPEALSYLFRALAMISRESRVRRSTRHTEKVLRLAATTRRLNHR